MARNEPSDKGKAVVRQFELLKSMRDPLDKEYRDCYELTMPDLGIGFGQGVDGDGISNALQQAHANSRKLDDTAGNAAEQLASAVVSTLNTAFVDGAVKGRWTNSPVHSMVGLNTWNGSVPNWVSRIKIHFNAQNATANTISLRLGHAGGVVSSAIYWYGAFYASTNVQPANNTMFPIQGLNASGWCRGVIELTRQQVNPATPMSQWLAETKMMMSGRSTTLIGDITIPGLLTQYIIAPSAGSWGTDSTIWIEYS